jgi:hypothetical protein
VRIVDNFICADEQALVRAQKRLNHVLEGNIDVRNGLRFLDMKI